mmetsp:Transcript_7157/g.27391  ORF Transcript_7157/g.27391 Transcript_7157/m.27391 type:complete len:289 (-) Transcript_7157:474-1340(-)
MSAAVAIASWDDARKSFNVYRQGRSRTGQSPGSAAFCKSSRISSSTSASSATPAVSALSNSSFTTSKSCTKVHRSTEAPGGPCASASAPAPAPAPAPASASVSASVSASAPVPASMPSCCSSASSCCPKMSSGSSLPITICLIDPAPKPFVFFTMGNRCDSIAASASRSLSSQLRMAVRPMRKSRCLRPQRSAQSTRDVAARRAAAPLTESRASSASTIPVCASATRTSSSKRLSTDSSPLVFTTSHTAASTRKRMRQRHLGASPAAKCFMSCSTAALTTLAPKPALL